MGVEEHRREAADTLGFGVVTVSDSRTEADDVAGGRVRELVEAAGHRVCSAVLVADEVAAVRGAARGMLAAPGIDVVVLTGGTGYAPRDLTPEAVEPLFERPILGFGELFRSLSYRHIGAAAMLSRATAGIVHQRAVFALPGSPAAVELALRELVLPEAGHLLAQVRRESR